MSDVNLKRGLIRGGSLGVGVILVVAILAAVNYLAWRHHDRFDWTSSKLYSLSEKTTNILSSVDQDLEVILVMDPQNEVFDLSRELLARYTAASSYITVRELDAFRNPVEAKVLIDRFGLERAEVIVIAKADGSDKRIVDTADLAEYDYSAAQYGGAPTMKSFNGERAITRAIVELVSARKPRTLLTTGHGEIALDAQDSRGLSEVARLLGGDNVELDEWASLGAAEVPTDADLVVVAGPIAAFTAPEFEAFDRFLARGGRMLWMVDPTVDQQAQLADEPLRTWLAGYGVVAGADIVIDPSNPLPFFGPETIFAGAWGDHPVVDALAGARASVVLPLVRSVTLGPEVNGTELVKTSAAGWGERDLAVLPQVGQDPSDLAGPLSLAVAVELPASAPPATPSVLADPVSAEGDSSAATSAEIDAVADQPGVARLVVIGDSDFATNGYLANANNATLFANAMNWLLERENQLGIESRSPEQVRLTMTAAQMSAARWLVLGILPLAAVAAGILIQRQRRSR